MELKEIQVSITNVCKIGCPYCYKNKSNPTFLTKKSLLKIIKTAKENNIDTIRFTGGDIFEHPQLKEFLTETKKENLKTIVNISITRLDRLEEIKNLVDYVLFSFRNLSQINEYSERLKTQIEENPKIKFMACMVFIEETDKELKEIFESIGKIPLNDFFFLRNISNSKKEYHFDLLKLSEKIVIQNKIKTQIKNPIKIANGFPLCLVSHEASEYCDGGLNDDGNSFFYVNENGDLKLNSYSSMVLGNIEEEEIKEIISKAKEKVTEVLNSNNLCKNCKIKNKCLGGIIAQDEYRQDKLIEIQKEYYSNHQYLSELQKKIIEYLPQNNFNEDYINTYFRNSSFFMQYPTLDQWKTPSSFEEFNEKMKETNNEFGLYLHFPFCNSRCKFCGIKKYPNDHIESYIKFMLEEIEKFKEILKTKNIKYIYIGGGTPTIIGKENFKRIFDKLFLYLPKENLIEITMETFPKNFDKELFDYLKNYITRLSIGVQCFNDKILQKFNRPSNVKEMKSFFNSIEDYPFTKSLDIIYGIYLDNSNSYEEELNEILKLNPDNITYQPLHNNKKLEESDELFFIEYSKKLDWLNKRGREILENNGYHQYTAEDFAKENKPKFEYQINFLNQNNILGIGIDTFSFVDGEYFANTSKNSYTKFTLNEYQKKIHKISLKSRLLEIETDKDYLETFSDSIRYLEKKELIKITNNKIQITKNGLNYTDLISQMLMINNLDYKQQ